MRLDLIIHTWRRPALLRAAPESVARAESPRGMAVAVVIVNNDVDVELPGLDAALNSMPFPTAVPHEPTPGKRYFHPERRRKSDDVSLRGSARGTRGLAECSAWER